MRIDAIEKLATSEFLNMSNAIVNISTKPETLESIRSSELISATSV